MQSDEYQKHKERSSRERDADTATQQRALKFKAKRLRDQYRQARNDHANISVGRLTENALSWFRRNQLQQFRSGELTLKLDAATREHGFGLLRQESRMLEAPHFT